MTDAAEERAIARTLTLYRMLLDDQRLEEWGALFAEDASWIAPGAAFHGRAAIMAGVGAMQPPAKGWVKHLEFPGVIEVTGPDSARAWSDLSALARAEDGTWSVVAAGRYYDELVRKEGGWRFKVRCADVDVAAHPLPGLAPVPAR
jgi:3-phenylpropionate/cinnamic acid dioxygenase small subunit